MRKTGEHNANYIYIYIIINHQWHNDILKNSQCLDLEFSIPPLSCRGRTQPRKILKCGTWLRRLWQPWFPWFSGGSQGVPRGFPGGSQGGSQGGSPGILHAEIQRASGQIDGGMLKDCGDFLFFSENRLFKILDACVIFFDEIILQYFRDFVLCDLEGTEIQHAVFRR